MYKQGIIDQTIRINQHRILNPSTKSNLKKKTKKKNTRKSAEKKKIGGMDDQQGTDDQKTGV